MKYKKWIKKLLNKTLDIKKFCDDIIWDCMDQNDKIEEMKNKDKKNGRKTTIICIKDYSKYVNDQLKDWIVLLTEVQEGKRY